MAGEAGVMARGTRENKACCVTNAGEEGEGRREWGSGNACR